MTNPLAAKLNPEQYDAVATLDGPLLIIAGAGSGKTRVITHRIANMLASGIPQSSILALTFTNKAAREMEERVHQLNDKKLRQLTISTFHAFGVQVLKKHIKALGWRDNFTIYDNSDQISLLKESARVLKKNTEEFDFNYYLGCFSRFKTRRATWAQIDDSEAKSLYSEYQQHLKLYNAVDFDDLITLPLEIFEQFPEILEEYRARYRYIMVDEFQDTSLIQYEMLRALGVTNRNVCVVGDDDQSIYSWRGANFENIRLFEKDFHERKEIKLEQNYRSTGTILEAANKLIANNKNRKGKALWTPAGEGKPIEIYQLPTETDEATFITETIKTLALRDNLRYDDFGVLIRTNSLARAIEESFMAANLPYRLSGGTSFFQRPEVRDMLCYLRVVVNPDDDISLLRIINTPRRGVGKRALQSITELATSQGSSLYGALLRLQELGEAASLKELEKGGGSQAAFDFDTEDNEPPASSDSVRAPNPGAPAFRDTEAFAALQSLAQTKPAAKAVNTNAPRMQETGMTKASYGALMELLDLIDEYRPKFLSGKRMAESVRLMVHAIDYWAYLVQEFQKNEKIATWRFHNIEVLCQSLERFEKDPDAEHTIYNYLNRVTLNNKDDDDDEANKGKVNLMTVHASKGLEFPVVLLAGVEDGVMPHKRSLTENEEGDYESNMEEERRLFYVAITRAQHKLIMTSCRTRTVMRQSIESALSPFLQEIPKELLEWKEASITPPTETEAEDFFAKLKGKFAPPPTPEETPATED